MTGTGQLGLSDDHVALHRVVGRFLEEQCPPAVPRAYLDGGAQGLPPFWGEIAELGWLGIHLPESHGGGGGGLSDLAVVLEEGRTRWSLAPVPRVELSLVGRTRWSLAPVPRVESRLTGRTRRPLATVPPLESRLTGRSRWPREGAPWAWPRGRAEAAAW